MTMTQQHVPGDLRCPACASPDGKPWPQAHRDGVSNCAGLVHREIFPPVLGRAEAKVKYWCDVCGDDPI
jgi:hypothetical protein